MYLEKRNSTVTSNGVTYYLNGIFRDTQHQPVEQFKVADLAWILEWVDHSSPEDQQRVQEADLSAPILVTREQKGLKLTDRLVVIDGGHRLDKAVRQHVLTLPGKLVSPQVMKKNISRGKVAHEGYGLPAWLQWC